MLRRRPILLPLFLHFLSWSCFDLIVTILLYCCCCLLLIDCVYSFSSFPFIFYCTFCSLKLASHVQIPRRSHRLRFAVGCFCWFLFLLLLLLLLFVVALILLTCSVLRVAAAGGARWKEQQAIVFFSFARFQATAFFFFCNMSHLAGRFSHIAWFRFDFLVFFFLLFFLVFFACRMPVYRHHGQRLIFFFSIKMNKMKGASSETKLIVDVSWVDFYVNSYFWESNKKI